MIFCSEFKESLLHIYYTCVYAFFSDDELELVVVATRFSDGKELKIDPDYNNADCEPAANPFAAKEEVVTPDIPVRQPRQELRRPTEGPTIHPPQDRYKLVHIQKKDPAYTRLKTQFSVESETQTRTTFRLPLWHQ